jgi:hypothetical protein
MDSVESSINRSGDDASFAGSEDNDSVDKEEEEEEEEDEEREETMEEEEDDDDYDYEDDDDDDGNMAGGEEEFETRPGNLRTGVHEENTYMDVESEEENENGFTVPDNDAASNNEDEEENNQSDDSEASSFDERGFSYETILDLWGNNEVDTVQVKMTGKKKTEVYHMGNKKERRALGKLITNPGPSVHSWKIWGHNEKKNKPSLPKESTAKGKAKIAQQKLFASTKGESNSQGASIGCSFL